VPRYIASACHTEEVWLVTRYEDVLAIFKDKRFVKDWRKVLTPEQLAQIPPIPQVMEPLSKNMLDTDPPEHERLRALVSKAFTPRLIERMRPRIQAIVDTLLDAVEDKRKMDLIDDYAFPLPITVIAELLVFLQKIETASASGQMLPCQETRPRSTWRRCSSLIWRPSATTSGGCSKRSA